jgi:hypothetical protein
MTENAPPKKNELFLLSALIRQKYPLASWRKASYRTADDSSPPVRLGFGRNFRFRYLQTSHPSDILLLSHPSHRSLTKVMCNQDGFFYCLDPALSGRVRGMSQLPSSGLPHFLGAVQPLPILPWSGVTERFGNCRNHPIPRVRLCVWECPTNGLNTRRGSEIICRPFKNKSPCGKGGES